MCKVFGIFDGNEWKIGEKIKILTWVIGQWMELPLTPKGERSN